MSELFSLSEAFKAAVAALGMKQVPVRTEVTATTLTVPYYPGGVDRSLLGHVGAAGVILAGGLYLTIKNQYFRIRHMGAVAHSDVLATVGANEQG